MPYLYRILSSWFLVCIANLFWQIPTSFTMLSFGQENNLFLWFGCILIFFVLLSVAQFFIKSKKLDGIVLALSLLVYATILVYYNTNFYFYLSVLLVLTLSGYYLWKKEIFSFEKIHFSDRTTKILLFLCAAFFILYVGSLTSLRYLTYSTPNFDFGIFCNMFFNMKETGLPMTTCERDGLLSHFAVHLSPIYYLLLPFYMLFPSPICLEIMQAVLLASGIIPLALLCRHYRLSNGATIGIGIVYVLYPALMGGCFYDLHENKFLAPLLLWLFYFFEKNKWGGVYLFALLVLLVKEDAAIYIAFLALYLIFSRKRYKHGILLLGMSVVYFLGAVAILNHFGQGIMSNRYSNFIYSSEDGLLGIIKTVLFNPAYVLKESFTEEKLIFMLQMLIPIGFLPFLKKNFSGFFLLCPFLLINLMSNYAYQHSIRFQYTYGVLAIFFYLVVQNLAEFTPLHRKYMLSFLVVASFLLCTSTMSDKLGYIPRYIEDYAQNQTITDCLEAIPQEASVSANSFFVPKLANRSVIYEHPSKQEAEYRVLDLRPHKEKDAQKYVRYYRNNGYEEIAYQENKIAVFKMPAYTP